MFDKKINIRTLKLVKYVIHEVELHFNCHLPRFGVRICARLMFVTISIMSGLATFINHSGRTYSVAVRLLLTAGVLICSKLKSRGNGSIYTNWDFTLTLQLQIYAHKCYMSHYQGNKVWRKNASQTEY